MLEKVKSIKDGITIAGDGRHDSMGHCAKYGAYTIFCCTVPMILHFSLIQVNTQNNSDYWTSPLYSLVLLLEFYM